VVGDFFSEKKYSVSKMCFRDILVVDLTPKSLEMAQKRPKRLNNSHGVFIWVLCNFYPYYPLFGFASITLQDTI
jgi:hypothetical protein